ncbi:MAG: hypothetical protein L7F78_27130, partial [Syntrophales bacterium LBB04]|nr:hypothetical protein [Syntrophales bacterium LBB04]
LTANVLGYFTARAHKYSWLRWILLIVTMFMIHMWGLKLGVTLLGKEEMLPRMAPSLFLPLLSLFALTYPLTAFLRIKQDFTGRLARFDLLVPTFNVCWAFILARYVILAMGGGAILLGIIGVIAGLSHLGLAWWLKKYKKDGAPGANAFVFAAAVLLALSLPAATGSLLASLPILAALSGACRRSLKPSG